MSVSVAAWQRLWTALGASEVPRGLYNQLIAAYSERHRSYHTLQHLRECLAHFEAASALAQRPAEVEAALWFHDAIHDPRARDNEERSADWAARSILAADGAPEVAERVRQLVLATDGHTASDDPDTQFLLDVDLAILGAAPARFAEYERQVRAEYAHVPPAQFAAARTQVLARFLARPRIYLTTAFHEALEEQARANLRQALSDATAEKA